ncbi:DUF1344 domain-containing protein [Tistrella bauzanensis]|uniref:DUF1344 domain-containing protein n=1 Tax=Tistrella arctica TaxID=3133430 RepID=A0ABU9YPC8_9PROT
MRMTLPTLVAALMIGGSSLAMAQSGSASGQSGTATMNSSGGTSGGAVTNPTSPTTTPGVGTGTGSAAAGAVGGTSGTHTTQGKIASISGSTITLDDGSTYVIGDPQLTEAKSGDTVTITYHEENGMNRATSIQHGVTDSVEGTGADGNDIGTGGTGGGGQLGSQPRAKGS